MTHRSDLPVDQRLGIAKGCICSKSKDKWLLWGWACPRSQARLDQQSRFICYDERWGARGYDTWTERSALLGTFGVTFEVVAYADDRKVVLFSDCIRGVCEECGLSIRAVSAYREARVCWACYTVTLTQLGDWLHANIAEVGLIVVDFLGPTVATDLKIFRSRRDYL